MARVRQKQGDAAICSVPSDTRPGLFHCRRWTPRLFAPVDIASLIYFRVSFGALMVWELCRYLSGGRADSLWIKPEFHFKYYGFAWVQPPPGNWMYALLGFLLIAAAGITIGWCYRICAVAFAVGFTWLFLIDQAEYLNHFYLICLLASVSTLLPLNRRLAVDCSRKPALRSDIAPAWTLWLLRAQIAIVYFYGGIAKLNADWLRGEPVRTWLVSLAGRAGFGAWLGSEWTVQLISYGGLLFDLLIVPLLLWRKTRAVAFLLAMVFHLTNNWLFSIGVFPWLSIAMTALFFPADWPRRFASYLAEFWLERPKIKRAPLRNADQPGFRYRGAVAAFLGIYLGWQLLMPLRHYLYPGFVSWTEEGHRFSWHMMLRSKKAQTRFYVLNPETREVWALNSLAYLSLRQREKMNGHPDMILQFAHHVAELMRKTNCGNIHVHVITRAELNSRPPALLIDPDVNLAATPRTLAPANWILPLDNKHTNPPWLRSTAPPADDGEPGA